MKQNQQIITTAIIAIVALGAGFFGGMKYQESQTPSLGGNIAQRQNGQMPPNGNAQRGPNGFTNGGAQGLQPVSGEVVGKDDTSITIQTENGNKIVIIAESTSINKTQEGTIEDVQTGETVTVFGEENSDGSLTANSVQIGTIGMNRMFAPEGM